jgi:hypothetical protein
MFQIEFEHEASNGQVYCIEVEGNKFFDEESFTEISSLVIHDEIGNEIDSSDPIYNELHTEAFEREYEVEIHNSNFDYYDSVENF